MDKDCLHCTNTRKIVIIGSGFVGSTCAFSIMESGLFSEIVLIDSDYLRAEGEALDISHGIPFNKSMNIYAGNYDDIVNASIIIITAGSNQKEGETRLDLTGRNIELLMHIIPEITKRNYNSIILVVSNPVDILTAIILKQGNFIPNKIIGSGTVLDTARLKYELGKKLCVDSRCVHAFIIGEHGDSEIAVWSSANIAGIPIDLFFEYQGIHNHSYYFDEITNNVKNSAYKIISGKQATYFGIATSVRRICEAIVRDEKAILPVSTYLNGEYGIEGVALSVPTILGKDGVEKILPIELNDFELTKLQESANILKNILKKFSI